MTLTKPPLTRPLGKSGIEISSLAWGMWRFAGLEMSAARAAIDAAFDSRDYLVRHRRHLRHG